MLRKAKFIGITAKETFTVGNETVVQRAAPEGHIATVFEDDGGTGYFYALDSSIEDNSIVDAVHIYNVKDVVDRAKPSEVQIGWSRDGTKSILLINGYPHAIFDFTAKRGYCRTGFPPTTSGSGWDAHDHAWDDEAIALFN